MHRKAITDREGVGIIHTADRCRYHQFMAHTSLSLDEQNKHLRELQQLWIELQELILGTCAPDCNGTGKAPAKGEQG